MTLSISPPADASYESFIKAYVKEYLVHINSMSSMYRSQEIIDQDYIDSVDDLEIQDKHMMPLAHKLNQDFSNFVTIDTVYENKDILNSPVSGFLIEESLI